MTMRTTTCYLCDNEVTDAYPNVVCHACDERAITRDGRRLEGKREVGFEVESFVDDDGRRVIRMPPDTGENPVFIDGVQCWRRYRFGGWVTMADPDEHDDPGGSYEASGLFR